MEAFNRLHNVCVETESTIDSVAVSSQLRARSSAPRASLEAVAAAAVAAAHQQTAALIVVLTDAGLMGRLISKFQPMPPGGRVVRLRPLCGGVLTCARRGVLAVLLVCESDRVSRQAYLSRGLVPVVRTSPHLVPALKPQPTQAVHVSSKAAANDGNALVCLSACVWVTGGPAAPEGHRRRTAAVARAGENRGLLPARYAYGRHATPLAPLLGFVTPTPLW